MKKSTLFKGIFSISLVVYLLTTINFKEFIDTIKTANSGMLLMSIIVLIPLGYFISTLKWQLLLHAQNIRQISLDRLFVLYLVGSFFSNFLPTEVGGDIIRGHEVGKINKKYAESYAAIFMERLTGFVSMILLGIGGLFFNISIAQELHLFVVFSLIGFSMIIVSVVFFNKSLMKRIKTVIEFKMIAGIIEKIKKLYLNIIAYNCKKKILLLAIGISLLFQFIPILYVYFIFKSFNILLPIKTLILFIPTISFLGILPITINSIGLREGTFVYFFSLVGIANSDALAASLIFRVGIILISSLGGIFYFYLHITPVKEIEKGNL